MYTHTQTQTQTHTHISNDNIQAWTNIYERRQCLLHIYYIQFSF